MLLYHLLILIYSAITFCWLVSLWFVLRHNVHMFQLNSYKPKVHTAWLFKNPKNLALPLISKLVSVVVFGIISALVPKNRNLSKTEAQIVICSLLLLGVVFLVFALFFLPKKQYKTPLKYTMRIKRLFATLAIIYLAIALIPLIPQLSFLMIYPAHLATAFAFSPFIVLLANALNRPLELLISKWYINDAKKIIKNSPNLLVIGITGSFGKTSVKYFLDELLSVKYNVLKTPGNFNTTLGVVKTIRSDLRATHDIFLCEMGAKNVGDIKEICDIVHPKMGVITSVGEMHLESFKSIENVRKTKFELADALPESGKIFLNFESEQVVLGSQNRSFVAYGLENQSGYYVTNLKISGKGSEFTVHTPDGRFADFRTALIGRHNVLNICGAIAVAHTLGISLDELKPAVKRLESVPHRLQLIVRGNVSIIDDAYNSNPQGAKAALETLAMAEGTKILVTPGMIELGAKEFELNKEFGKQAAAVCDKVALVGKKQTEPIYQGLIEAGYQESNIFVADSLNEAMNFAYGLTNSENRTIILLENDLPDNY